MSRTCDGTITFLSDAEPELGPTPVYQINIPCSNCSAPGYTLEIKTNDISYYGFNVRSVVATAESIIKDYLRRQRIERNSALLQNLDMLNTRKSFLCSSNISISSSSDEDLLLDQNDKLFDSEGQMSFHRSKLSKKITVGSWLILSPVTGGWNVSMLKGYILKVFGVECIHTKSILDSFAKQSKFDFIIKFETSNELNAIVLRLRKDNINDKFLFLSFEKTYVGDDDSDSSSDDSRCDF